MKIEEMIYQGMHGQGSQSSTLLPNIMEAAAKVTAKMVVFDLDALALYDQPVTMYGDDIIKATNLNKEQFELIFSEDVCPFVAFAHRDRQTSMATSMEQYNDLLVMSFPDHAKGAGHVSRVTIQSKGKNKYTITYEDKV